VLVLNESTPDKPYARLSCRGIIGRAAWSGESESAAGAYPPVSRERQRRAPQRGGGDGALV